MYLLFSSLAYQYTAHAHTHTHTLEPTKACTNTHTHISLSLILFSVMLARTESSCNHWWLVVLMHRKSFPSISKHKNFRPRSEFLSSKEFGWRLKYLVSAIFKLTSHDLWSRLVSGVGYKQWVFVELALPRKLCKRWRLWCRPRQCTVVKKTKKWKRLCTVVKKKRKREKGSTDSNQNFGDRDFFPTLVSTTTTTMTTTTRISKVSTTTLSSVKTFCRQCRFCQLRLFWSARISSLKQTTSRTCFQILLFNWKGARRIRTLDSLAQSRIWTN